jgi:S1-C subfamily serine protease
MCLTFLVLLVAAGCGSSEGTRAPAASAAPVAVPSGSPDAGGNGGASATADGSPTSDPGGGDPSAGTDGGANPDASSGTGGTGGTGTPGQPGGIPGAGAWDDIPTIVANAQPSVVSIVREGGEGSGVVWSEDGVIITNHHVIEGVDEVVVAFADGSRADGQVLASDPLSDLAVVQTDRTGLPAAEFATEIPPVGSLAIALGNPLGFENSVTAGIVSGAHRAVPGAAESAPALVDLIQTDAAISPGNSGGALVGGDGRVIGVNVAYIPPAARAVSIGFAIPAPTVVDVVGQLLDDGTAEHAFLGVQPAPITPEIAEQFGIEQTTGALVVDVVPDSPAAAAEIEPGDVIIGIGDNRVETVEDLIGALRQLDVGAETVVHLIREGEEIETQVTLGTFAG